MSRTVIANVVVTLDGRTTGPAGAGDMSVIAPHGVSDEARNQLARMTSATTAVMGRKNSEGFAGWWPQVAAMTDADPRDRQFSEWLTAVEKVVFSRTVSATGWTDEHVTAEDPAAVVARLAAEDGGDIRVLSSVSVIRHLLAANLIDRLELTISPEIAGAGGELLFDPTTTGSSSWEVVSETRTGSGAVAVVLDRRSRGDA